MMRRSHTPDVKKAIEKMIVVERRTPGDMAFDILPARALADLVEVVIALIGEELFSEFEAAGSVRVSVHATALRAATDRIASMIGS